MKIIFFQNKEEKLEECFKIRREVFIKEQKIDEEIEIDDDDKKVVHLLLYDENEKAIGTARINKINLYNEVKLQRICLLKESRGKGYGNLMMRELLNYCNNNFDKDILISLDSQIYALKFYEKNGFIKIGDNFFEVGIEHCKMIYKK
jgi:predicted GNAT family N-acyltransferase